MERWGLPSPVFALKSRNSDSGVTNVRNVSSPHWRRWLGIQNRCVVPFTSFAGNEILPNGTRPPVWFALDETRPLAFFAGIWTRWTSVRKVKEGETTNDLFAFAAVPSTLSLPMRECVSRVACRVRTRWSFISPAFFAPRRPTRTYREEFRRCRRRSREPPRLRSITQGTSCSAHRRGDDGIERRS
jgi:hypothetical protein